MVDIQFLGPDVSAPGNQWPLLPVAPGFVVAFRETRMGDILDFPPGQYILVPTGTGRYYRPMEVRGALPLVWNHQTREFLMQENLPHLHGSPLANCLTVSTLPDPGYEEREAAARRLAERRAASRRRTNRRALERAAARRAAAEKAAGEQPVAAAPLAPAAPAPVPVAPVPVTPVPVAPVHAAPALVVPALVAPAGGAPNNHHQAGNGEPVEGSWAWWNLWVPDDVVDRWKQEEAERQKIPIVVLE
ncbi:hypothetical protein BCON_0169g00130 [Botryotinia convoluta]|uniref:Uncharacterized protein n=1 Tax=Botryotinia convoluta TaxID=54673 RepID=A0A4Z1HQI9_9HELO|nr:hypothetical protein BCON_0169g00130 [Botryotinia convoluta]